MKRFIKMLIGATGVFLVALFLWAAFFLREGTTLSIESAVLGEERAYTVFLPAGYAEKPDKSFPVIYALDGERDRHGKLFAANARMLAAANLGIDAIIVAVHSEGERIRDFSPASGGKKFTSFLGGELMPAIDAQFRVTEHSTVYGHSYGGLYVVYVRNAYPEIFDNHIAIVPSFFHAPGFLEELVAKKSVSQSSGILYLFTGDESERFWNSYRRAFHALKTQPLLRTGSFPLPHALVMIPGQMAALMALKP